MESAIAEAQAHAERVETQAAEHLSNYTSKLDAEWLNCATLREKLEQLQSHLKDIEAMCDRKVARLEEQIAVLQADNQSLREGRLSSVADSSCPRAPNDVESYKAATDCADCYPCTAPAAQQERPSSPSTPRMSVSQLPFEPGVSAKLSVERLRAHERLQEWSRPSPTSQRRKANCELRNGELRASTEPRSRPCETILAFTRNGEHARPPWTARNSSATRNSELSRPFSPRSQAQAGPGRLRAVERPKGTQLRR